MAEASKSDLVRNELVAVGTASVVICESNPRKALVIRNSSTAAQVITVNLGYSQAVADYGIVLKAGEAFCDSTSEGYICFQGTITAISDGVSGQVSIMER